jgi:signal peptidase
MKYLTYLLHTAFFLLLLGAGAVFFAPSLPYVGSVDLKIVKSGSMEPTIMTGAVVLVSPKKDYVEGDVITFADEQAQIPTTHRIVKRYAEGNVAMFVTKGDANEEVDAMPVAESAVIGSVIFSLPYAGYVFDFARQPVGFALLIVMPALLIILGELDKIRKEIWGRRRLRIGAKEGVEEIKESMQTVHGVPSRARYAPQLGYVSPSTVNLRPYGSTVMYEDVPQKLPQASVRYCEWHTLDLRRYMSQVPREEGVGDMRDVKSVGFAQDLKRYMFGFDKQWALPVLVLVVSVVVAGANFIPYTMSYFSDTERSLNNVFRAGTFAPEPEPFAFSVAPTDVCYNYLDDSINFETEYTVFPETVTSYDVAIRNVLGDTQLCDRTGVSIGANIPVQIEGFTASSLVGPVTLAFDNLDKINSVKRECTADIVFSTLHEGVQYWATSSLAIGDLKNYPCASSIQTDDDLSSLEGSVKGKKIDDVVVDTIETQTGEGETSGEGAVMDTAQEEVTVENTEEGEVVEEVEVVEEGVGEQGEEVMKTEIDEIESVEESASEDATVPTPNTEVENSAPPTEQV